MPIGPGNPDKGLTARLNLMALEKLFTPERIVHSSSTRLCLVGLWLRHDELEQCYRIAQQVETSKATFRDAIVHRRLADFSSSKYWWRKVRDHATFSDSRDEAKKLTEKSKASEVTALLLK